MQDLDLAGVSKLLKDIDFVMLNTHTEGGKIAGRPMSNNRDVEYDGDSWFFLDEESRTFTDLSANPDVTLSAQAGGGQGASPTFLSIEGRGELIQDKAAFEAHWLDDLERWWPQGVETPGLALLKVRASRIHYWRSEDEGELKV